MSKILITGATGFLGSHLLKKFIGQNEVIILKRSTSNCFRIVDQIKKVKFYDIDNKRIKDIFEIEKPEIVIHTACLYEKNQNTLDLVKTNLFLSLEILEASIKYGVNLFINSDTSLPKDLNSYSLSKFQFKEWLFFSSKSINVVNFNIEFMYGKNMNKNSFLSVLIDKMMTKTNEKIDLTSGTQKRDFIFIDDVVDAFYLIIKNKSSLSGFNEFDVSTGYSSRMNDFIKTLALKFEEISNYKIINRLNFGAIPYRENELMEPQLDNFKLKEMGWQPIFNIEKGISKIIEK
jgi:CDP-paratose synthetase